jgi:glutamyl-tRNA reductase
LAELERTLGGRLKHLADGDRAALAQMVESAVNKLLHAPTTRLKAAAAANAAAEYAQAVTHLFDLPDVQEEQQAQEPAAASHAPHARRDDDDGRLH